MVKKEVGNLDFQLKELASVQIGQNFKCRLDNVKDPNIYVIQMKDLTDDNRLNTNDLYGIDLEEIKEKYLVQNNDILFRSRGKTNTAALIDQEIISTVVGSPLFLVRVISKEVEPAYLCWYINHPSSQAYFARMAKGTSVQMIDKQALMDLVVYVPPLDIQEKVVALHELCKEEQRLMRDLANKKKSYMDAFLLRYVSQQE